MQGLGSRVQVKFRSEVVFVDMTYSLNVLKGYRAIL